jgi:hypothetical protein
MASTSVLLALFLLLFKEYALWTSFEIGVIMGSGFDPCDSRKEGALG